MAPNKPSIGISQPALSSAKHPVPRVITAGEEKCDSPSKTLTSFLWGRRKKRKKKNKKEKEIFWEKEKPIQTSVIPENHRKKKSNDENEETSFYTTERGSSFETPCHGNRNSKVTEGGEEQSKRKKICKIAKIFW